MNERIKELEKQAYTEVTHERGGTYMAFDKEKFAELIVAECADIAKHHVMNISTYADAEFVEKQIEKHFGVEE